MYIHHHIDFYHAQGDRLLRDPKKYFVWEVYFCQKKYIFDPERSTICAKKLIVKLREREGQRVDLGRKVIYRLWMVDGGWWISFP